MSYVPLVEAADRLGMTVAETLRLLMSGELSAVYAPDAGGWHARVDDVEEFVGRAD